MFGIDVSHFQGHIDWTKASQHLDFVYVKTTQGVGSSDAFCQANSVGATNAGLKVGYYHFATLNSSSVVSDATAEANWFCSVMRNLPTPSMPIVLDIETEDPKVQLSPDMVLSWINTFFSVLSSNGYREYALYSYSPFLNSHLPSNHNLGNIPLWIAAYTSAPQPRLPIGWTKAWLWQYTDKGRIDGISTTVDLNKTL